MKTSKRGFAARVLTTVLFVFMIFSMTLLSSCVATVRTPHRHHSSSTVIISEGHHDNGNHYGQKKNKNKN